MKKILFALFLCLSLSACKPEASPEAKFDNALTQLEESNEDTFDVTVTTYENSGTDTFIQVNEYSFVTSKTNENALYSFCSFNTPMYCFDSFEDISEDEIRFQISQSDLETYKNLFNEPLVNMIGTMKLDASWQMTKLDWEILSTSHKYRIEITKR